MADSFAQAATFAHEGRNGSATAAPTARSSYWREIGGLLCLKALGLAILYVLFFAPSSQPAITGQIVANHLLTASGAWTTSGVDDHAR